MKLTKIRIINYRNLNEMELDFDKTINFIVGENNIGKSNLLNCINKVFCVKTFSREDFKDESIPIKIEFRIFLNEDEKGIFDDLVDPKDNDYINIIALQENYDEYLKFYHTETNESIPAQLIKKINVINYDSLRNPKNEIDFAKTRGAGAFLNYIVARYVNENLDKSYINKSEAKKIEKYASAILGKISVFERFQVSPQIEEDSLSMLTKIMTLKDGNNINIPENGYGVQFNMLIVLSLLEKIIDFVKHKKEDETEFSALLIFDEPEIHLHPYLQRTIINDILNISNGKDEKFNELLKEYFSIDKFEAQVIITTHSPNMLLDKYNHIIRLFNNRGTTKAVSGVTIDFNNKEKKQLMMQFEYVKEAMFARSVIIVEGDSEFGSFSTFAYNLGIDFDREGIALIKAGGADSIIPLIDMFNKFGICAVGVIDKDKKDEKNLPNKDNLFYTKSKCYDSEVVKRIIFNKSYQTLERILCEYDVKGMERCLQKKKLNKIIDEFKYKNIQAEKDSKFSEFTKTEKMYEVMFVSWFDINKGILLGKVISNNLDVKEIPVCYVKAIKKVKELAQKDVR